MQILSSLSGLQFSAASAGFAPTNSADVSAIASAYQVVSATATQLYAGTAYVTSVNETPISASRAGNAANASLANSAWYDGTGRLISALPDSATVSAIASSYAESAVSSKLDESATADFYSTSNPSGFITGVDLSDYQPTSAMTAYQVSGDYAFNSSLSSKLDTSASSSFYPSDNPSGFITGVDLTNYATTSYVDSSVSSKQDTLTFGYDGANISSIDGSALAGGGGGGAAFPTYITSGTTVKAEITTGFQGNTATRPTLFISGTPSSNAYPRMLLSENHTAATCKSSTYLADAFEFYTGDPGSAGDKIFRADTAQVSASGRFVINSSCVSGAEGWTYGSSEYGQLTGVYDTVSSNSATWGGGGGIDSATCSAIASAYAESAVSGKADSSALSSYALSADVSGTVDLVSTQSANWGGSALALSAGPGVKLEKVGNTLVASTDETLLWSGVLTSNQTAVLSESIANFRSVKVYGYTHNGSAFSWASEVPVQNTTIFGVGLSLWSGSNLELDVSRFALSNTTVSSLSGTWIANATMGNATANITKVYGITRTAEA